MDYEAIDEKSYDDMSLALIDIVSRAQFKLISFLLIVFMIVNSDIFIMRVLSRFDGAVDYKTPTTWGTALQGIMLCAFVLIIDIFIRVGIV